MLFAVSRRYSAQRAATLSCYLAAQNSDPEGTEFRVTMDQLNRFMRMVEAPAEMRTRLREYFHQTKHLQQALAYRDAL